MSLTEPPKENLALLETEQRNSKTSEIDRMETDELVRTLHAENHTVAAAIDAVLPVVSELVEIVSERLALGGRLFYVGAGTSGRLGVLDASECPPTFGVSPEMVQGIIAGGERALTSAVEGAEDSAELAAEDLAAKNLSDRDVVVAVAASGRTPYAIGALDYAKSVGAVTGAIVNVSNSALASHAQYVMAAITGPEPVTGSTRMKAGTAQKLLLNLISTASMIKLGKVYQNLMVDVQASNQKLRNRAVRIVQEATKKDEAACKKALEEADGHAKTAIVSLLLNVPVEEAKKLLNQKHGHISRVVGANKKFCQ
ncbi:MAG: N-acetylmuramic acid 6-phosphate etherase [Cyanobacteria bacterium SZAS LIN-2]|nr:N-acetylmuramic acid 6-phosphate etherase [Cyanobacteria bacterium SZAS LIN-2]